MINAIIDESAKEILQNTFSGKAFVESLEEQNVAGKATAQVSNAETIIPENIKENVQILGVEGSYSGQSNLTLSFVSHYAQGDYIDIIGKQSTRLTEGETINVDDIITGDGIVDTGLFRIQANSNLDPSRYYITFTGKYDNAVYDNERLAFDGVGTMWSVGYPGSTVSMSSWNKQLFGSNAIIKVCVEPQLDVMYEKDPESDVFFNLHYTMNPTPIADGSTIITLAQYHLCGEPWPASIGPCKVYINDMYLGQDQDQFLLLNKYIVDNKAKIKVLAREIIDYQLDPATNTRTTLYFKSMGIIWMPVDIGSELTLGIEYKIKTQDVSDIYINDNLMAEDTNEYLFTLTEELLHGQNHLTVKSLSDNPTINPTFISDPQSSETIRLRYMDGMRLKYVLDGEEMMEGITYSVANDQGWELSENSDIYINDELVAENTKQYSFNLTSEMINANNQVVIKVIQC